MIDIVLDRFVIDWSKTLIDGFGGFRVAAEGGLIFLRSPPLFLELASSWRHSRFTVNELNSFMPYINLNWL